MKIRTIIGILLLICFIPLTLAGLAFMTNYDMLYSLMIGIFLDFIVGIMTLGIYLVSQDQ